ncbi:MAG: NAD(P)/FAD-dependent oxidoreductase [Deltaproteobacteria bacterium]|nr:NAD(P)/FAD-dependent oxidoreductase [Deltaproteobacteria bacterium]
MTHAPPHGPTLARLPRVVIVGGGFGGLTAARELAGRPVEVTVIDRTNHHLFQPLLYQVAMAGISPADISYPIRSVLRRQENARVLLDEVRGVDLFARRVRLTQGSLPYDYLVLATGAQTNYFGHAEWSRFALGLKDLDDAVEIRRRVLLAFEAAEREPEPARRAQLMTFIVIGGGPTGVELAGALGELARFVLARDFRRVDPTTAQVLLLEGGPRILPSFDEELADAAVEQLDRLGVKVRTGALVREVDATGVYLDLEHLPAATVLWAAGVSGTPLVAQLGVPLDRAQRVVVEPDCSLPGHPEVFAIGDMAAFLHQDGAPLPGLAPVALQQGRFVARALLAALEGQPRPHFRYVDKGSMATIGRSAAVAQVGRLKLRGFLAWLTWLFVHILFLVDFRNRAVVLFTWIWSYLTYKRGARLITGHRLEPGPPSDTAPPPSKPAP